MATLRSLFAALLLVGLPLGCGDKDSSYSMDNDTAGHPPGRPSR